MKRCSQCHFTFADDQQFCDFDHTELIDVPEPPPAFQNVPAVLPGQARRARRLRRSRVGLAILALSGVATSALLVGYFDSVSQSGIDVVSNSAGQGPSSLNRQGAQEKPEQALIEPPTKPRKISTQRKLAANDKGSSMPSSILKWDVAPASMYSTASRTARSRQNLRRQPPSQRSVPSNKTPDMAMTRRRSVAGGKATHARNHRNIRERNSGDGKDSKFVAVLKKTGSILTKPFRL